MQLSQSASSLHWLTVEDPSSLYRCVLCGGSRFHINESLPSVSLAQNACLSELKALLSNADKAEDPLAKPFSKSYFLLVENKGKEVSEFRLVFDGALPAISFSPPVGNSAVAVCMGYDDAAGNSIHMEVPKTLEAIYADGKREKFDVPGRNARVPIGISKCGQISFGHPNSMECGL